MANLILAKLALWGSDIDTFELAASRSESDGSMSALLIPHQDPEVQILLSHEESYPVHLVSFAGVPPEIFADPRLDAILLFLEETRPANLSVRRQDEGELEISLWIFEEGFDRQSLNLAVAEVALVRRILSRRIQSLQLVCPDPASPTSAFLSSSLEEVSSEAVPSETVISGVVTDQEVASEGLTGETQTVPSEGADLEAHTCQATTAEAKPLEFEPNPESNQENSSPTPEPDNESAWESQPSASGRARRGQSLPVPPCEPSRPEPAAQTPTSSGPESPPAFDPFAATAKGPSTVLPPARQSIKVTPTVLPGLSATGSGTEGPAIPPARPNFDPFAGASPANRTAPPTVMPGLKQPLKIISTVLPGLSAKKEEPANSDFKNCPQCQGQLRSKARFCTWCGHRFGV